MRSILFLVWMALPCGLTAQAAGYKFVRFDTKMGLSHNQVNCFLQDHSGFIWIGTQAGLNRFDGYSFKVFRSELPDSSTLANDYIEQLMEDPDGKIWIDDGRNFTIFDPHNEQFDRNADQYARRFGLPDARVTKILKGPTGEYWINHLRLGLCRYSAVEGRLTTISHVADDTASVRQGLISDFQEDSKGRLWLVYQDGVLECLDPSLQKVVFRSYGLYSNGKREPGNYLMFIDRDNDIWIYSRDYKGGQFFDARSAVFYPFSTSSARFRLSNDIVRTVSQDDDGIIWVATDHGGLNLFDKKRNTVRYLQADPNDDHSLSQNSAISLYKSPEGIMWVGTFKKGFNIYHRSIFQFPLYRHQPADPGSLPSDDVNAFAEDRLGNLWIGTNGGGLIYFDRRANRFTQYRHIPGNPASLSNDVIVSLHIDHTGKLWIGTYFGGLNSFDGRSFTHYFHNPNDPNSLADDRVWEIFEDSHQNLWVGTLRGGLDLLDRSEGTFRHYRAADQKSIRADYISSLAEDREGNLWIGTDRGVDVLEWRSGKFRHFEHQPGNEAGLSNNLVTSILKDSGGHIWVATMHGLNLYDRETGRFRAFGKCHGLPDDAIVSLTEDNRHNLWMGTPNGLANFRINSWEGNQVKGFEVRMYNELDGLQGRHFNENAAIRTSKGEIIIGGANGMNIIYPGDLNYNNGNAKAILTDFQIFTRSVRPKEKMDGRVILEKSIAETDHLTLSHAQNVFSIEFAALSFFHPEKKHFRYRLAGFNDEWFPTDHSARRVTYTNLDPGDYVFEVQVSGEDGKWQDGTRLNIKVLYPFWQTPLAYLLYFLLAAGGLWLAWWVVMDRTTMRFNMEQERREARSVHELDLLKIKFLTNISHEFRTPLSLILTPLERLLVTTKGTETEEKLLLVYRNAKRLLHLVNQLLDFKKIEVEESSFMPAQGDLVSFVREISHSFAELSDKKHISFSFSTRVDALPMAFDQAKMSRALFNLLSNAFKFTPEHGKVSVRIERAAGADGAEMVEIHVIDSGIGIPAADRHRIFERFYQQNIPDSMINQGSGIGLSITREFIKMHNGTIRVESEEGQGSTFIVSLPVQQPTVPHEMAGYEATAPDIPPGEAALAPRPANARKPLVLLVEDNDDFRNYLRHTLEHQYDMLEATNGKTAWTLVLERTPDLILSDVVMPGMDGMELCRAVKSDRRVSHIPVILLTARAAEEQQLLGYETGADAYITKPFRMDLLLVRMQNLIRQSELRRKQARQVVDVKPHDIPIISLDEQLVTKAMEVVEKNMGNTEFSVEELSHALAMSRVHLYKKLLALTGKTPIEFIRVIRLKRAAQLLEKSQLTVAEVAYKVGFNNPKYFSRYFKEEYGLLPAAYQKRFKQKT